VLVCSKAGYLSFDGNLPADPRGYFMREYVETGILDPKELAGGMHCIAPRYLDNQIERSRRNLGSKPSICSTCTTGVTTGRCVAGSFS